MAQDAVRDARPGRRGRIGGLDEIGLIVPVAMIGAPTVILERIPGGHELDLAVRGFEQLAGRPVTATMPIEAGGINSTFPLVLCARRGLPLVDGDGMGRAFPEVQMVTLGAGGATAWPLVLADESSNVVSFPPRLTTLRRNGLPALRRGHGRLRGGGPLRGQRSARPFLGCPAQREPGCRDRQRFAKSSRRGGGPVRGDPTRLWRAPLFTGQVAEVERSTQPGFVRGRHTLKGLDDDAGNQAQFDFQNENLIVRTGDDVLAAVPDLISLMEADSGHPLTTEGMRFGLRVKVVGIPASSLWWRPEALPLVEPRVFGYDMDPVRLEAV